MRSMKRHLITSMRWLLLFFVLTLQVDAAEEPPQNPALKSFYAEVRMLVLKHYPKASSHLLKETIHFEADTRIFIIHEQTKTGEWQDPWEVRGPKPGGIHGDLVLQPGQYQGAVVVPQTFDKRYFNLLLLAPYSKNLDAHLLVHLAYPKNVNPDFLKQITDLISSFQNHGN